MDKRARWRGFGQFWLNSFSDNQKPFASANEGNEGNLDANGHAVHELLFDGDRDVLKRHLLIQHPAGCVNSRRCS